MADYQIHQGNNTDILKQYEDNHFDAIVTDPPYGIEFLGKDWDQNTGAVETWSQCLRVLKPGGHLLAFSAARTYHHLASNIESVGFEIRDQLMWLYASGFPKAQDIGKAIQRRQGVEKYQTEKGTNAYPHTTKNQKMVVGSVTADDYAKEKTHPVCTSPEAQQWHGWKTALKPAHEPIVMARKPFKGSTIDNVMTHGVGALNIDDNRIPFKNHDKEKLEKWSNKWSSGESKTEGFDVYGNSTHEVNEQGRFPSNVMGEVTGYQKFFYCPKVSRKERHCGFEQDQVVDNPEMLRQMGGHFMGTTGDAQKEEGTDVWLPHCGHIKIHGLKNEYNKWLKTQNRDQSDVGNNHPTVKPVALMRYLIKLVTPPNSTILDPFTGSGSTGMAAVELGHEFVGCELDPRYVDIANRRIKGWLNVTQTTTFHKLFDTE
tara:strand:- start:653 stop:1939 length:1287 start_codon:yes stop_codon:yes gene_type:complete